MKTEPLQRSQNSAEYDCRFVDGNRVPLDRRERFPSCSRVSWGSLEHQRR